MKSFNLVYLISSSQHRPWELPVFTHVALVHSLLGKRRKMAKQNSPKGTVTAFTEGRSSCRYAGPAWRIHSRTARRERDPGHWALGLLSCMIRKLSSSSCCDQGSRVWVLLLQLFDVVSQQQDLLQCVRGWRSISPSSDMIKGLGSKPCNWSVS